VDDEQAAVRDHLALARRAGLDFDAAWTDARAAVPMLALNTAAGQ
jgi:hypothetical protein